MSRSLRLLSRSSLLFCLVSNWFCCLVLLLFLRVVGSVVPWLIRCIYARLDIVVVFFPSSLRSFALFFVLPVLAPVALFLFGFSLGRCFFYAAAGRWCASGFVCFCVCLGVRRSLVPYEVSRVFCCSSCLSFGSVCSHVLLFVSFDCPSLFCYRFPFLVLLWCPFSVPFAVPSSAPSGLPLCVLLEVSLVVPLYGSFCFSRFPSSGWILVLFITFLSLFAPFSVY